MVESKVEKRNRPPKSCEPCRLRKLKCNQELPCGSCIKRGVRSSCQFAPNADRGDKRATVAKSVSSRLKRLEDLITKMSENSGSLPDPQSSEPAAEKDTRVPNTQTTCTPEPLNKGLLFNANSSYTDSSHWSSLLEEIKDMREQLSSPPEEEATLLETPPLPRVSAWPSPEEPLTDIMFSKGSLTLAELVRALPARTACDRMVSFYFRLGHAIAPILHPPTFQKEYASFWENQEDVQPLWLALLFSILAVAVGLEKIAITAGSARGGHFTGLPAERLGEYARQCLILGSYSTVNKYSMEALIVLLQSSYFHTSNHTSDPKPNLWFLIGIVIRLAVRRGYHRDPQRLPNSQLTPFDAEMRRRLWVTVFQIDSLMSFHMGLPSMIPWDYCDTELPRNLEYTDLSPGMTTLPPSRPLTDSTPILYTIVKAGIMSIFKSVVDHTRSLAPRPYGDTMKLDADLQRAYEGLPENFRYKPLDECLIDTVKDIMNRTTIELLYLKSIIVLHRKYLTIHRHDKLYAASRHSCIEAAITVLKRQVELHGASQPGGPFFDSQWMISTLTASDFILAAMVISLEATIRMKEYDNLGMDMSDSQKHREEKDHNDEELLEAMKSVYSIWLEAADTSLEAKIAATTLEATIKRAGTQTQKTAKHDAANGPPGNLSSTLDSETLVLNGMDYINWTFLDNTYSDPLGGTLDMDSWMLDAAGGTSL